MNGREFILFTSQIYSDLQRFTCALFSRLPDDSFIESSRSAVFVVFTEILFSVALTRNVPPIRSPGRFSGSFRRSREPGARAIKVSKLVQFCEKFRRARTHSAHRTPEFRSVNSARVPPGSRYPTGIPLPLPLPSRCCRHAGGEIQWGETLNVFSSHLAIIRRLFIRATKKPRVPFRTRARANGVD